MSIGVRIPELLKRMVIMVIIVFARFVACVLDGMGGGWRGRGVVGMDFGVCCCWRMNRGWYLRRGRISR